MKTGIDTPGHRALRQHRYSLSNHAYLITFVTQKREKVFLENHLAANAFCIALNDSRLWTDAKLMCWVLMPDHVHILLQLGETENISRLTNRIKSNTARSVNLSVERDGRLWAQGFHDRAIRMEETIVDTARYVVMNPVRAGLVKRLGMYPYRDAIWL
jgi:putative transposase